MISRLFLAVAVVAFAGQAAAPDRALAAEPYHLGVALGLTGTGAPYSRQALEGIEIAVEEINAQGGLLGAHPIRLFIRNTKTQPEVAERVVTEVITNHRVRAIIGTYSSSTALAIKPICRANGVLHIATISNSEDITKLDPSPYTFSVVPNTYMMAKAVALGTADLASKHGWKRYVTIASDYAWGRSNQQIQISILAAQAPALELLGEYWPPLGHVGFNSFVVAVKNQKPDFVLESIAGADKALWNRTAWDYRLHETVAMPGALISVTELQNEGPRIRRGAYGRARAPFFAHLDVPMMKEFIAKYEARYGRYPSDWAVMAYDGVHALRQGVENAASVDTEAVRRAMKGLAIDTMRGRLSFRAIDNQLEASAYLGRVTDDPRYDFPIYADLVEMKGRDIWRPEAEIRAAREQ